MVRAQDGSKFDALGGVALVEQHNSRLYLVSVYIEIQGLVAYWKTFEFEVLQHFLERQPFVHNHMGDVIPPVLGP